MNSKIYYKINGLNFNKFLKCLKEQNINVYNFNKIDYKTFTLAVSIKNNKSFLNLCKKFNYSYSVQKTTGALNWFKKLKTNLVLVLTIIIILVSITISSNCVYKIKIYGIQTLTEPQIISVLNKNGCKLGKLKSSYNQNNIKNILATNLPQVSFVSSVVRGNTLIININEKLPKLQQNFLPITSPYNLIIKNVILKSGTLVKQIGQTAIMGETIVEPYILYKNGSKLNVEPSAVIEAYIELSHTTKYEEYSKELVETGKKFTQTQFSIFGLNLGKRGTQKNYENYNTKKQSVYPFKNLFLPIKQTTIVYSECVYRQVYVPINKASQNIIEQNKNVLYNTIYGKQINNAQFETTITNVNNVYYVTTYLKANITF